MTEAQKTHAYLVRQSEELFRMIEKKIANSKAKMVLEPTNRGLCGDMAAIVERLKEIAE